MINSIQEQTWDISFIRSMHYIIILAAGMGRRFGSHEHKCLSPFLLGEGTLPRLLRQLSRIVPDADLSLVTGHQEEVVSAQARSVLASLRCTYNTHHADGSSLGSLCVGLQALLNRAAPEGAWVLFGDTV